MVGVIDLAFFQGLYVSILMAILIQPAIIQNLLLWIRDLKLNSFSPIV